MPLIIPPTITIPGPGQPAVAPNPTGGAGSSQAASSSSASGTSAATINQSLGSLANNFQTFLSLLTTQLRNQDPLQPLDSSQFTQQITQMTGVEQQLLSNQLLQQLVTAQGGLGQAAGLIGKTVGVPATAGGQPAISGVVTGVQTVNGKTELTVGGQQVPLSSVTSIGATAPSATIGA
ncbi:MAG: flagellar hook assembly protein FlgD [Caulobacterales bacterium]